MIANVGQRERRILAVRGIVQGVGFRPFIYSLAQRYKLTGLVWNDSEGACVEVEGNPETLDCFLRAIREEAPPLARIEAVTLRAGVVLGDDTFRIEVSRNGDHRRALISPDVATCDDCVKELFEPTDRRFRYPFINCTNCGPRFTITRAVPYDRAMTTMAAFPLCPLCQREYDNPSNRRFHAQPNACPACGPQVRLLDRSGQDVECEPLLRAAELILQGAIVAVKGLGGYHLSCNPLDVAAVATLRRRKVRYEKPFALMVRDIEHVRSICKISPEEESVLREPARPIVLLQRRPDDGIAGEVAPRQKTLGVMLAYTPLHYLLLHDVGIPLVMTSGNRSDEPIAYEDEEAFQRLGDIADYFLLHNRAIHMRCDDSVVRVIRGGIARQHPLPHTPPPASTTTMAIYPLRRSRGYAPAPLRMTEPFNQHTLACGGELKNTFCVAKESYAFLSHHIGDLENYETLCSFREGIDHYCRLFDIQPDRVAYDLHPEYLSTKYALELEETGLTAVGVQHHHAHIASCLADNDRPYTERVIGVAFDGTGYGTDGAIWGGEFLEGSIHEGFVRQAHLAYTPLPGGEAAIRQPWRMAVAHLLACYGLDETLKLPLPLVQWAGERNMRLIAQLIAGNINSPLTSSAGRLFDAVAALVGVPGWMQAAYEGQAAVELELAANDGALRVYPFRLRSEALPPSAVGEQGEGLLVEVREVITGVVEEMLAGRPVEEISSVFHRTMAEMIASVCSTLRDRSGVSSVALSGGTFQNMLLLNGVVELLEQQSFVVYQHHRVPANDGGLALGQAVLANSIIPLRS